MVLALVWGEALWCVDVGARLCVSAKQADEQVIGRPAVTRLKALYGQLSWDWLDIAWAMN